MRRVLAYPLLLFFLVSATASADTNRYRDALKAKAARLHLQDDRYWDILLHYKRGWFGTKSLVDDQRFFLSPRGKTDPSAELDAAIDGLFVRGDEKETPRCRFPARYDWLIRRLDVDGGKIPPVSCPTLSATLARIDARSASLIFASGHLNSPASMFGHTLLRFDSSYESPLLSYAVNYAAQIDPRDNGLFYAVKGISGLYPGYYSILPYYDKVKEYGNMDQRDLWEYRLALSPEAVRRMVLHVMELQGIYSDYYFFKENCSYDLLFLLEVGDPSARLTDRFRWFTIPVDTLKAVRSAGLISDPVFRPSQARRIRHIAASLSDADIRRARSVLDNAASASAVLSADIPDGEKARILDLASDAIQVRYSKKGATQEEYRKQFLAVLAARSTLRTAEDRPSPPPVPERPENGHGSSRAELGAGVRDGKGFFEVSGRPAYHDLLDADGGFVPGSQIEFFRAALRYYPESGRVRLQRADLVHIVSLAPRDAFFRPVSWKFRTGFETKPLPDGSDALAFFANPGGGLAWDVPHLGLVYALLETEWAVAGRYRPAYAAGIGLSAGVLATVAGSWKVLFRTRAMAGVLGDANRERELSAVIRQGLPLGRRQALFLDVGRTVSPGLRYDEAKLSWALYF